MPCESDYLNPTGHEQESQRVCMLLVYAYGKLGKEVPEWIVKAAGRTYGNTERLNEATARLCECCRSLSPDESEAIIYDAHDPVARKLASWWERHQEWDERRVKEEQEAREKAVARKRALTKLTGEEIEALELRETAG